MGKRETDNQAKRHYRVMTVAQLREPRGAATVEVAFLGFIGNIGA